MTLVSVSKPEGEGAKLVFTTLFDSLKVVRCRAASHPQVCRGHAARAAVVALQDPAAGAHNTWIACATPPSGTCLQQSAAVQHSQATGSNMQT